MKTRKYNKKSRKMYAKGKPKGTSLKNWKEQRKSIRKTPRSIRYQTINSKRFDSKFKHKYNSKKKKTSPFFFDTKDMFLYKKLEEEEEKRAMVKAEPKTLAGQLKTMLYTLVGY